MPIELSRLATELQPERTILLLGAGASIPSHAPSVRQLIELFEQEFKVSGEGYTLREFTAILENQFSRKRLVETLRRPFKNLRPTGSMLNIPLYPWKSIFTTNYDTLIEQCYSKKKIELRVYQSNFDFTAQANPNSAKLFKLHGSIENDIADGHQSRIILTDTDYDHTQPFREGLYDRLRSDLHGANLIIIGHSLADEDIKSLANNAAEMAMRVGGPNKITLLMYVPDNNRAGLWERRGFNVCFGGLDEFFSAIAKNLPDTARAYTDPQKPLDACPALTPITIDVAHEATGNRDVTGMFNGWPAKYADIQGGLTFRRSIAFEIEKFFDEPDAVAATILGASGVGKTTAARQVLLQMQTKGYVCWEHKTDFEFSAADWLSVAKSLSGYKIKGVLFVDEAHSHLHQLNLLLDSLRAQRINDLKIVLASTRNHWNPRVKTPAIYKLGKEFPVGRLTSPEIDGLLNLVDSNPDVRNLVGEAFNGFSRYEKRRRLVDKCESETFVCLKNIFSSEKFDEIILREYAALHPDHQEIYRIVAAMESVGIRVHRQLVIRLLGIPAETIAAALTYLTDIINEYPINEREGLYGWRGRHSVIVSILTKYKYHEPAQMIELFERVIDCISPTFDIELRSIREICNIETGLPRIADKNIQNRLLRKMMSIAPGERVPRHRLIRNLIQAGEFDKADAEIRIFEKDFRSDAPTTRYRVQILMGRALDTPGILQEDRIAILGQARDAAHAARAKYPDHKLILGVYCEVGIALYKLTGSFSIYDDAMSYLKKAEADIGDPDISRLIRQYERRIAGQTELSNEALEVSES